MCNLLHGSRVNEQNYFKMRNLIVSYRKLPQQIMSTFQMKYPDGFDHDTFEFEMPGKQIICRALLLTVDEVNYLIKIDQRPKRTDLLLDEDW